MNKKREYVLIGVNYCEKCECLLENVFFLFSSTSKKSFTHKLVCNSCLVDLQKPLGIIYEAKNGVISSKMSYDLVPIFLTPIGLKDSKGNETVFSAVNLESDETKDGAWRSKVFPSLEGATIGKSIEVVDDDETLRLEQVEKEILSLDFKKE